VFDTQAIWLVARADLNASVWCKVMYICFNMCYCMMHVLDAQAVELIRFCNKVVVSQALATMLKRWDGHWSKTNIRVCCFQLLFCSNNENIVQPRWIMSILCWRVRSSERSSLKWQCVGIWCSVMFYKCWFVCFYTHLYK